MVMVPDGGAEIKERIEALEAEAKGYLKTVEGELKRLTELSGELSGVINELARIKSDLEREGVKGVEHEAEEEQEQEQKEAEQGVIEDAEDAIAVLSEELERKKKEVERIARGEQYLTELQYLKADFENYKRRMAKEKREFADYALECFITELLPIKDSLEAAMRHGRVEGGVEGGSEGVVKGVEMTVKQLDELLRRNGLEEIKAEGEKFDPFRHEVVGRDAGATQPENTVTEVVRKGYIFHDKVLRPAMVKIAVKDTGKE